MRWTEKDLAEHQSRRVATTVPTAGLPSKSYVAGAEKVYTLKICPCPPATNKRDRMHHHQITQINRRVQSEVYYQVREQGLVPLVPGVSVEATRCGPRDIDPDGLPVVVKPVLDALRYIGVIEDDTPKWITSLSVKAGKRRANPAELHVVVRGKAKDGCC